MDFPTTVKAVKTTNGLRGLESAGGAEAAVIGALVGVEAEGSHF